jgi:nicotinate-nucleotide pyrophosphorylase (carboxylating)
MRGFFLRLLMKKSFDFTAEALAALARADAARALAEDVGSGDLTAGLIDPARQARAQVVARESAVVCGSAWVEATMRQLDPEAQLIWHVNDGERCEAGQVVFEVRGLARALLSAERTALNFLQLLSAVATKTAVYVDIVKGTRAADRGYAQDLARPAAGAEIRGGDGRRDQPPRGFVRRRAHQGKPHRGGRRHRAGAGARGRGRAQADFVQIEVENLANWPRRWTPARAWCCWTT